MATLSIIDVDIDGTVLATATPAGGGDVFPNNGQDVFLYVANANGSSINVTFTAQNTAFVDLKLGELTASNKVVAVANGATKVIGPFPEAIYSNSSRQVAVLCSATSGVTVAAIRFNPHGK